jgi:hypothetical protein
MLRGIERREVEARPNTAALSAWLQEIRPLTDSIRIGPNFGRMMNWGGLSKFD